jgi:hypothetical protein
MCEPAYPERVRARRGILIGLGAAVVLFVGFAALQPVVHWDNWPKVRVTGRLLDARTGIPLSGTEVYTLWEPDDSVDEALLRMRRRDNAANQRDPGASAGDPWYYCFGPHGLGETRTDGSFEACLAPLWGGSRNAWGCSSAWKDPSEFHGCRALRVRASDGRKAIVDCTQGRWTVVERYRRYLVELGEVRVDLGH